MRLLASAVHQLDGALFWGLSQLFLTSLGRVGPENAVSDNVSYFGRTTLVSKKIVVGPADENDSSKGGAVPNSGVSP